MKTRFLRTTLAAALLAATPAFAADAVKPVPFKSAIFETLTAASNEIQGASNPKDNLHVTLEKLRTMHYSEPTRAKLVKVFGNDHPLTIVRTPGAKGGIDYAITLPPASFLEDSGINVEWTELALKLSADKAGRSVKANGTWDRLTLDTSNTRTTIAGMTIVSAQKKGVADFWLGTAQANVGSIKVDSKSGDNVVQIDGVHVNTELVQRAKVIDMRYNLAIDSVGAGGEKVEAVKLSTRFANLNPQAMQVWRDALHKDQAKGINSATDAKAVLASAKAFARASAVHGASVEIEELSARFHGNTASATGRIGLAAIKDADFDSMPALMAKIVAHFELKVPVALVQDITRVVARKQASAAAKPGETVSDEAVAQLSQSMTDVVVGKLLGGGYAKLDNGVLTTSIDIKDKQLLVGGKLVQFPSAAPPPAPQAVPKN